MDWRMKGCGVGPQGKALALATAKAGAQFAGAATEIPAFAGATAVRRSTMIVRYGSRRNAG
jgi:hypothetical protein